MPLMPALAYRLVEGWTLASSINHQTNGHACLAPMILFISKSALLLLTSMFLPSVVSVPYLTQSSENAKYQDRGPLGRSAASFSASSINLEHLQSSSTSSLAYVPRAISDDRTKARTSPSHDALLIAVPLACVSCALFVLFLVKLTYRKQRRLNTIHVVPTVWEGHEEQTISSGRQVSSVADAHTLPNIDLRSMRSRSTPRASRHSSTISSKRASKKSGALSHRYRDSLTGILVGMFGSPNWEMSMQREYADHRWRLRRETISDSLKSQQRHTWHSQPRQESHMNNNSTDRASYMYVAGHSSLRVPHVSSFGELYRDALNRERRRPRSLNAVIGQISSSHGDSTQSYSQGNVRGPRSYTNTSTCSSGFSALPTSISKRPSTIGEVDTPPTMGLLAQDATFHYRVTDFSDGDSLATSAAVPSVPGAFSKLGDVETAHSSTDTMLSSTHGLPNRSSEPSIAGSCRRLAQFPSPPATPGSPMPSTPQFPDVLQVNNVCIQPHYFDERLYDLVAPSSDILDGHLLSYGCKDHYGKAPKNFLAGFSPLTLDLGSPVISDLISDVLNMRSTSMDQQEGKGTLPTVKTSDSLLCARDSLGPRQYLSPNCALVLNRHHLRVREHVPFSIVSPPPVYLKASHSAISLGQGSLERGHAMSPRIESLVDLAAPARPSPLRRVVSFCSIGSSRASSRMQLRAGDTNREFRGGSFMFMDDTDENNESTPMGDTSMRGVLDTRNKEFFSLKPKASHASLFLDLGGSFAGIDDDRSESYSFGVADYTGQNFDHSQPSSSGIIARIEECSDEDIEYIVEVHSEAFAPVQHNDPEN